MSVPSGCRDAVDRFWAYLDRELDDVDVEQVESHLRFCLRCCGELAFAREVRDVLAGSRPTMPADVHHRLDAFLETLPPPGHDDPRRTPR